MALQTRVWHAGMRGLQVARTLSSKDLTIRSYSGDAPAPKSFDVEYPENRKLKFMEKVPIMPPGVRPISMEKKNVDMVGPELVHNKLIHKQYGIIALEGGALKYGHFEAIRTTINKNLNTNKMFAMWRVDAPWKSKTKKGISKRMGGGKGAPHHYVTPVKAGRVILEIGGEIEYPRVEPMLTRTAGKLPFKAMAVSQDLMEEMEKEEEMYRAINQNPYTFEYIITNDMMGCHQWCSPNDKIWFGKYRLRR